MKKNLLLLTILISINSYSIEYVPLVKENVEWQVLYTDYPYEFMQAKTVIRQVYTLFGDTVINDLTYKKFCLKTGSAEQPTYKYYGAVREQDKRIYYIGDGYFTYQQQMGSAKIKRIKQCLSSHYSDAQEVLLYDFNAKSGDNTEWGYYYAQIISDDSVLVGNSYRRRLHLSNNDDVVEGIGTVTNWLLFSITPMLTCGENYFNWEFESYSENGKIVYKAPGYNPSIGYQTVYSHRKAYYQTDKGRIETLKTDTAAFMNDSVFYPSKTLQLVSDECYDPYGGGWAGKKIIVNNHWNYFFNDDNDTIKIKTDAVLNESWTLFRRPDMTIIATVTRWDTATVMTEIDSVKAITLRVYDMSMSPLPHRLDGVTMAISKRYGMIKALNFLHFPAVKFTPDYLVASELHLVGITKPELGIQNTKWFDVFDYQEGDEFHYSGFGNYLMAGGGASESKYIIRILKRENFNDSIRYTEDIELLFKNKQNASADYVTTYDHYQITNVIYINSEFDQDPGIPVFNEDSTVLQIYPAFSVDRTGTPEIYLKENDCWRKSPIIDDACMSLTYAKGRGVVISGGGCWQEYGYGETRQVYYKKGSVSWGVPLVLTGIEDMEDQSVINVYPNPVTDEILIDMNDLPHSCTFELLDAQGKLIQQTVLNRLNNRVNLSELNRGMYLYRIASDNRQIKTGKIIKD